MLFLQLEMHLLDRFGSAGNSGKSVVPPHFVYSMKLALGVEVHGDCPVYHSARNVCQHSLAAAEDMGVLSECEENKDYMT